MGLMRPSVYILILLPGVSANSENLMLAYLATFMPLWPHFGGILHIFMSIRIIINIFYYFEIFIMYMMKHSRILMINLRVRAEVYFRYSDTLQHDKLHKIHH